MMGINIPSKTTNKTIEATRETRATTTPEIISNISNVANSIIIPTEYLNIYAIDKISSLEHSFDLEYHENILLINELTFTNNSNSQIIHDLQLLYDSAQDTINDLLEKDSKSSLDLSRIRHERENWKSKYSHSQQQLNLVQNQLQTLQISHENHIHDLKKENHENNSKLINSKDQLLNKLNTQILEMHDTITHLENSNIFNEKKIHALETELEIKSNNNNQNITEIQQLENEIQIRNTKVREYEYLVKCKESLQHKINILALENAGLHSQVSEIVPKLAVLEHENLILKRENSGKNTSNELLEIQNETIQLRQTCASNAEFLKNYKEITDLKYQTLETDYSNLENLMKDIHKRVETITQEKEYVDEWKQLLNMFPI